MSDEFNIPPAENELGESTEQADEWNLPPGDGNQNEAMDSFFANDGEQSPQDGEVFGTMPSESFGSTDANFGSVQGQTEDNFGSNDNFGAVDSSVSDGFGVANDNFGSATDDFAPVNETGNDNFGAMDAPTEDNFSSMPATEDNFGAMPAPTGDFGAMEAPAPAFEPPAALPVDKGAEFTAQWEARLKQQEGEEAAAKQTLKEAAEKYLDNFHDKKTDEKLSKMEKNRKDQEESAAENERLLEIARSDDLSRWKRVYELVNTDNTAENETSRMARLLLNLKIKGTSANKK